MIVHLTGGIRGTGEEQAYFMRMIDIIHKTGNSIAVNWIETSIHNSNVNSQPNDQVDWHMNIRQLEQGLNNADVVIVETTAYRLFHGYEIARALDEDRPVLMVSRKSFREFAISGVENPLLEMKVYKDEDELEEIVSDFLKRRSIKPAKISIDLGRDRSLGSYIETQAEKEHLMADKILLRLANKGMQVEKLDQ